MGLTAVVQLALVRAVDRELLAVVQSITRPELDVLGSIVTVFGQAEVTAGLAAGLVVARLWKRTGDFWVPLAIALVVAIETIVKLTVAQSLPPRDVHRDLGLFPGVGVPFVHSFPSGHVARDTFLLLIAHGWSRIAIGLALAVVALSRVYTGQHWPSDVVGGLLLGAAVAWVAVAVARRPREA